MNLPKQAPAVSRKLNRFAAVPMTGRVRPAGLLDILGRAAKGALGAVLGG